MKRQRSSSYSGSNKKPRLNRQNATVASVVKKELRKKTDWRYADDSQDRIPVYNTGASIRSVFTSLVRGDTGLNNFQGNDIRPQAVTFKYFADTAQTFNVLRVILFQWFDAQAPTLGGVLQSTATNVACVSPTLVTNKKYIKILYDKTHMLAPTAGDTNVVGNGTMDPVTVYIPGKRLRVVRYNSSTNVCQDGNIYVLAISDDTALGTVNLTYYVRTTFSDS